MAQEATSKQEVSGSSPLPVVVSVDFFVKSTLNLLQNK